jgi:dTDP-4-dehydrorhamnose reductase
MKQLLLGTGLSGLLGTRLISLLSDKYEFEDLSLNTGIDITDASVLHQKISQSRSEVILHLAAKADVDGCEKDKPLGTAGNAWRINVIGTENVVQAAKATHKRVLYISTDFVFDGSADTYSETDQPHPINWYGKTKYEGERIVMTDPDNLVIRLAYPYMAENSFKKDFLHHMLGKLTRGEEVVALTDHYYTPTFGDDIAHALGALLGHKSTGIYHVVGSSWLSPYEACKFVAEAFGYDPKLVVPTTVAEFYRGRAPRPYKLKLKNDKIASLGVRMHTFTEGIAEIKRQGVVL